MLRFVILSLALIALINSSNIPRTTATPPSIKDKAFVLTACSSTKYPKMCYNALSPYSSTIKSDPIKLCLTSVSVNLNSAKSTSSIVSSLLKKFASSPEVSNILKDCLKKMKDSSDKLKQVITESARNSPGERKRKLDMWAAVALIEMTKCMDKLKEVKGNAEIKKVEKAISELSMTTSNTLALITRYLRF